MSFWERIKQGLRNFMLGRNGPDRFCVALLWFGLVLNLIGSLLSSAAVKTGSGFLAILVLVLTICGYASYFFCIFRMFSRNLPKRQEEERRFVSFWERLKTSWRQAVNRFKNRRQYKYFRCPCCKTRLRLPRGRGVVTVTCKCCHTSFTQKA